MSSNQIIRHVVFTRSTKHVVSGLFKTMDQAISCQDLLNKTVGRCQYFAGMIYYVADPVHKDRYMITKTHPEGLTTPLTPPPAGNNQAQPKHRTI